MIYYNITTYLTMLSRVKSETVLDVFELPINIVI